MHKLTFDGVKTALYEEVTSYGLKVVIAPIENSEITVGGVYVATGSLRHEEKIDKTKCPQGLASYLSKIIHKATNFDVKKKLEELGAIYQVKCDYSSTVYSFVTSGEYQDALDLLLGQCTNFSLTEDVVESSKESIIKESMPTRNDLIRNEVLNNLYFSSHIKELDNGTIDDMKDIHLSSLKKFFLNKYVLENLTLFLVGKVDLKSIDEYLNTRKLIVDRKPVGKREDYINKEEYGQVVKPLSSLKVADFKPCLALGIKFLPRMELYERYGDNCFAIYQILPLVFSYLLEKELSVETRDSIECELKEGGEDAYLYITIKGQYDDAFIEKIKATLMTLTKKFKRKDFKNLAKVFYAYHVKDFASPQKYFDGLVNAIENHMAYPSLIERIHSLNYKHIKAFLKDMQAWIYSFVKVNYEENI